MVDAILRFRCPVDLTAAAVDGSSPSIPRVSIIAYRGDVMNVPGYGPTVIDLAGLDATGPVQLLAEHAATLDGLLGTGWATKERSQLRVDGPLSRANPITERLIAMAKDGVRFSASVGVQPTEREFVREGTTVSANGKTITAPRGGLTFVRRGVLRETSIVALGADAGASVAIAASISGSKGKKKMSNEYTNNSAVEIPDEMKAAWDRPGLTDSERVMARWNGTQFHDPGVRQQTERFLHAALGGGLDFAEFERELLLAENRDLRLKVIRDGRPQVPSIHASQRDRGGANMIQASLLCHLGAEDVAARAFGDQTTQMARDAGLTSFVDILQAAWREIGHEPPRNRNELLKASFSTASISNIVSGAQNKILLDQWQRLPLTCLQLCKQVSAKDFKEGKAVRLVGRDAMFEEVGAAGEIKHGWLQDSASTYQLATYARRYAITRQHIINDDLGAMNELPRVIARGAGLKMESVFWTLVLANAGSYFGTGNGNQLTAALDLTGLGSAVSTMRALTDDDGEPVLVEPRYLVVPPALEAVADSLYASTNVVVGGTGDAVTTQPANSAFAGKYKPVCSPYISNANYTGNSTTQWYLFADPSVGPAAFMAAFLNGQTTPTIEQNETDFNTLGVGYRGYLDFGFAQCDSEGAVKSTGAGS